MAVTVVTVLFFTACACETKGTKDNSITCNDNGQCNCRENIEGGKCSRCSAGYYNFPVCTG